MKIKIILIAGLVAFSAILFSFQHKPFTNTHEIKKGMIKVTILYPAEEGKTFNMDYYSTKHMPMVAQLLGDSLKMLSIDKGVGGGAANAPAPFVAIGYLYFDRLSAYLHAFAPVAEKIRNDIPNYTDIKPVIQISEVLQ
ncbi:MAG: EthD family reductase [Chitinophagaceae bacterium]